MGIKHLAEAVILQSLEDLWEPDYIAGSMEFFKGDGFKICADIAEINRFKQYKILHLLGGRKNAENRLRRTYQ
jgi:hypothetical protein